MSASAKYRNLLITEGRVLADGRQSQLTLEEWLYAYNFAKDDLVGAQVDICEDFADRIKAQIIDHAMETVAH